MTDDYDYQLKAEGIPGSDWVTVTKDEWIKAERAAGFRPPLWWGHPDYMTTCATGGFSNSRGISGRLVRAVPATDHVLVLEKAVEALNPLADAVFNDNGDMTVSVPLLSAEECIQAYFAVKRIRAMQAPPPAERAAE